MKNRITPLFTILLVAALSACASDSAERREADSVKGKPAHHTEDGFQNHPFVETAASKGFFFYLRRAWGSVFTPDVPEGHALSEQDALRLLNSMDGDRITWLGHASFLIRLSGKTILTDPFLTEFASPVSWAGPRRFVEPGIGLEQLPPIDIIIVSHSHYDHLDDQTITRLANKERIQVVVPLGLKAFFTERGYQQVTELDWQQTISIAGLKLIALPSVHDSARSISDHNKTLWSSWAIEYPKSEYPAGESLGKESLENQSSETENPRRKLLFIGDSAYSDFIYKKIGKEYGPFDYAVIPIGAYEPRELMWMSHVNPEEAVSVGVDIDASTLIASHWGTVSSLSDEPIWEPPKRFNKAGFRQGYSDKNLWVMKVGETKALRPKTSASD